MEPKRSPLEDDERIKKLMSDMGYPDNRTIYQAFKQIIMETRLQYEDAWPDKKPEAPISAVVDRFERACMAYERLGNMKKDDEKTRNIRKEAMAEYAQARAALFSLRAGEITDTELVTEERKRCAKIARRHTHHALWVGLPVVLTEDSMKFGIALAQRIEAATLQGEHYGRNAGSSKEAGRDVPREA